MIRLFIAQPLSKTTQILLNDKQNHYLLHVMRCKAGDEILCFNGQDGEWLCLLQMKTKKQICPTVTKQIRPQTNQHFCALCPALIKKDNMDFVLQKATELGVTDIYPLITDRTVHPHFNQEHARLIVQEASEQCERLTIPIIHPPVSLTQVHKLLPKSCICYYLAERAHDTQGLPAQGNLAFFVGPEGGWSLEEISFFEKNTYHPLHFSIGILRAETACIAILACWQIGREICIKK